MIQQEISLNLSENFVVKPLNKESYFRFKEVAINYEISLEVKRKKLIELKEEKVQEAKLIYAEREELNNYIKEQIQV